MSIYTPLSEIIDGMEWQSDEITAYVNRKTGDVVTVRDEDFAMAENCDSAIDRPDWEAEALEIARDVLAEEDKYIALPDRFEINEYQMMERFAYTVADERASSRLRRAIQGRGAFRHFKDAVYDLSLDQDWFAFRDRAYEEAAIAWCQDNDIQYTRGGPTRVAQKESKQG